MMEIDETTRLEQDIANEIIRFKRSHGQDPKYLIISERMQELIDEHLKQLSGMDFGDDFHVEKYEGMKVLVSPRIMGQVEVY